jgi:hypothetical protein
MGEQGRQGRAYRPLSGFPVLEPIALVTDGPSGSLDPAREILRCSNSVLLLEPAIIQLEGTGGRTQTGGGIPIFKEPGTEAPVRLAIPKE